MTSEKQIRWTLSLAGREFRLHRDTLKNKLVEIGEEADTTGRYTTAQITKAVFGDTHQQRLRKTTEEADKLELENRRTRGETIDVSDAIELTQRFCFAIRQKIILSPLPPEDQRAIIDDIRSMAKLDFSQVMALTEGYDKPDDGGSV